MNEENFNFNFYSKKLKSKALCNHCNIYFATQQSVNTHLKRIMDNKKRVFDGQIEEFRAVKARDINPEDLV